MKRACYCYFVGRDADGLMDASNEEPAIMLFVGMTVSQYLGIALPPLFCIVLLYFFLFSWFVLVVVSNNVLQAICLITCVSCICHKSKHLPWHVELHSRNQSHMELTVSTITEIATFEPNFERLILVQLILMPENSQTLFVWASRRGCLRKISITSCVQCQGTANSVPQDLLAIVGRVQRYCRS
jgi:hypothetical protein